MAATQGLSEAQVTAIVQQQTTRLETLVRQLQGRVPLTGTGSPENVVPAPLGTLYVNEAGGTSTTLYVKEGGGTGNTGWIAK
jgi:hypothetical protein